MSEREREGASKSEWVREVKRRRIRRKKEFGLLINASQVKSNIVRRSFFSHSSHPPPPPPLPPNLHHLFFSSSFLFSSSALHAIFRSIKSSEKKTRMNGGGRSRVMSVDVFSCYLPPHFSLSCCMSLFKWKEQMIFFFLSSRIFFS